MYKPSDLIGTLDDDYNDEHVDKVLTLETFADFRQLRLLDITFVDLAHDLFRSSGPTWSLELHPKFAGSKSIMLLHLYSHVQGLRSS